MATIKPFRAIRPKQGLESRIAALPYDVYNRKEAKVEVNREPLSFLRIDRAETQFPDDVDTYDERVYQKAKQLLDDMLSKGELEKDTDCCFYLYEQVMNGRHQTGLVATASVFDYENNIIKKHENTREEKELDRIRHVDTCNAQTGPIFLAYRTNAILNSLFMRIKKDTPLYSFESNDGIGHTVWKIKETEDISLIESTFESIGEIYIADGHHRCASAEKVSMLRRKMATLANPDAEYNFFLSVLFPDSELMIMDYNRVVKDLSGMSEQKFVDCLSEYFTITVNNNIDAKPGKKGEILMIFKDKEYLLKMKEEYYSDDPVDGLDVALLQKYVLDGLLGIQDPKTDQRIDFVGGVRGIEELRKRVNEDCAVAFAMYPTSIQELFGVADANRLMPPKSTWFEPKLRSGLFIHEL